MANENKSHEQILKELADAKTKVVVGGYYAHYKHPGEKRYQVVDVAVYENTESICVVYKQLEEGVLWIRPLENFLEEVEFEGKRIKRFTLER